MRCEHNLPRLLLFSCAIAVVASAPTPIVPSEAVFQDAHAARERGDVAEAVRLLARMASGDAQTTSTPGADAPRAGLEYAVDLARWIISRAGNEGWGEGDQALGAFFALSKCHEKLGNWDAMVSVAAEMMTRLRVDIANPGKKTRSEGRDLAVLVTNLHSMAMAQYEAVPAGNATAALETMLALRSIAAELPQLAERRSVRRSMLLLLHLENGATNATIANSATVVHAAGGDGGWSHKTIAAADLGLPHDSTVTVDGMVGSTTRCDIDRHERLSPETLLKDYVARNRPVIVGGLAGDWKAHMQWQRKPFLEKYGGVHMVSVKSSDATKPFATQGPSQKHSSARTESVRDYLDGDQAPADGNPPYTFGGLSAAELEDDFAVPDSVWGEFSWYPKDKDDSQLPDELLSYRSERRLFYLGRAGSGAQMHAHSAALNTLVYGRKKWWLMPPAVNWANPRASDSNRKVVNDLSTSAWLREHKAHLPAHLVMECTQHANETLFVPEMWGHGTLNLQESIGIAFELGDSLGLRDNKPKPGDVWHNLPAVAHFRNNAADASGSPAKDEL